MQKPDDGVLVAELGSLSLEFTRLSQLTGDPKFFDAVQRISDRFEQVQSKTKLPGMWPVLVNPQAANFGEDTGFTLGAMADSLYEYLPKVGINIPILQSKLTELAIYVARRLIPTV
jgi:mannosyl-oligosaccharide alpha-1,2-mannosidase